MIFQQVIDAARQYEFMAGQDRDQARVKKTSEVFTPTSLVVKLVDKRESTKRIDDKGNPDWSGLSLEPSCGDGQFLSEVLMRKVIYFGKCDGVDYMSSPNRTVDPKHYDKACKSIRGVDLVHSNVVETRKRLRMGIEKHEKGTHNQTAEYVKYRHGWRVLSSNIIEGDFLVMYDNAMKAKEDRRKARLAKRKNKNNPGAKNKVLESVHYDTALGL